MKEFEVVCPISREPRIKEIEAATAGRKWVLKKRSVDARKTPVWRYRYEAYDNDEEYTPYALPDLDRDVHRERPIIVVGAGPAGMFASLKLISLGLRPIILERGKDVHSRKVDMAILSREGVVNPDSNYCYGEGGAGAFSDGKLYTRSVKRGDVREVLYELVKFGASKDILIDAHPHIGSDKLGQIVENIRMFITRQGGEYHFSSRVVSVSRTEEGAFEVVTAKGEKYCGLKVILATGHSARDVYEMLRDSGGTLEAKGFALGVRVEHPQEKINWSRYHGLWKPGIPPAEYSFVEQVDGRGVFSFCMCPGGILVPSSTENGAVVLNGMSNSSRSGKFANAGVVVQIEPEDIAGDDPFRLMDFQHSVEQNMYKTALACGAKHPLSAPAQRMEDFCTGKISKTLPETTYHPGVVSAPLHLSLPEIVSSRLRKVFSRVNIRGYYTNAALILGAETRTSSPVRVPRDSSTLEYVSMKGVYPCGEGAGYSGGIVSSAIDGINVAVAVKESLQ